MRISGDTLEPSIGSNITVPNGMGINVNNTEVGKITNTYGGFKGNIIQVQSTTLTSPVSISIGASDFNFKDILGLSVNITPRYINSRILLLGQVSFASSITSGIWFSTRFVRDSTPILIADSAGSRIRASTGDVTYAIDYGYQLKYSYPSGVDTNPNTTNQITYMLQVNQGWSSSSHTIYINRTFIDGDSTSQSRYTSSITAMEIQQ